MSVELAKEIIESSFAEKTDLSGERYVNHLYRVCENVPDYGSGNLKQIALLHDLLEDCPECKDDVTMEMVYVYQAINETR